MGGGGGHLADSTYTCGVPTWPEMEVLHRPPQCGPTAARYLSSLKIYTALLSGWGI